MRWSLPTLRCLAWIAALAAATVSEDPRVSRAVALYDGADFPGARALLEALDTEGRMTGPLLYRLYFCQSEAGEHDRGASTLARALEKLEFENASTARLEVPFYLANTYVLLNRPDDAKRVAAEATGKLEAGAWKAATGRMAEFQAGRLYQLQGRVEDAATHYRKMLAGAGSGADSGPSQVRFACRFLSDLALAHGGFAEAEPYLERLSALPSATGADCNALAVARARQGKWPSAAEAWRQAVRLDPANSDDPRYSARLADLATEVGALAEKAPDGRAWSQLSKENLEEVMKSQSAAVGAARERAGKNPVLPAAERKSIVAEIASTKRTFVTAGIEYVLRGLPIRETAFGNGYAALIFQDAAWQLPAPAGAQN